MAGNPYSHLGRHDKDSRSRWRFLAKLLTKDEAQRIAVNIAKLAELLTRRQTWGVRRGAADCG
jgi:ribosomal protein L18E